MILDENENNPKPLTNVSVRLIGENGNAFNILGKVRTKSDQRRL